MTCCLTMPLPPSNNHLYSNACRRRVKSKHYRSWISLADNAIRQQKQTHVPGDVKVEMYFGPRDRRRDLDNMTKAAIDRLVHWHIIVDDNRIVSLTLGWSDDVQGCMTLVEPA